MSEGWSKRVEAARARLRALRELPAPERAAPNDAERRAVEALFVSLAREAAGLDDDAVVLFDPSISGASYDAHGALRVGPHALDPARPRLRGLLARSGPASRVEPAALGGDLAAWALALERGVFDPRDGRALIEAASRLVEGLPASPDPKALAALASLAAVERALPAGALRGELRHVVRAAVTARLAQLEGQGERPGAARLALAIALAFEGSGLLPPGAIEQQVATLMGEAPEPEPREPAGGEVARLEEALGDVVRAVAEGDAAGVAAAAQALAEASQAAAGATPQMARAILRLGFARAAARVVDPAGLRRLGEAFRPVLGGDALAGTPLAEVLRAWTESRDAAAPSEETGDPVIDTLAERLFRRGDAFEAAAPLARRPALAEALLAGVERRLNRFSIGSRAMDSALRLGLFAEDKLTRFDRRYRTLEALLSAAESLGDVGLFAHFDAFAALELGRAELVFPTIGTDGGSLTDDYGYAGFGGFGGFGELGGLGAGLDSKALAALAAMAGGGGALGGRMGKLSSQMLRAITRMAGKGPGALAALLGGSGGVGTLLRHAGTLRALSSPFSSGSFPGLRAGGLGGATSSLRGGSSVTFGAGHLALGLTGGGGVGGFHAAFSAPGGPRGGLLLPALARQSMSLPRGPQLAGIGGFGGAGDLRLPTGALSTPPAFGPVGRGPRLPASFPSSLPSAGGAFGPTPASVGAARPRAGVTSGFGRLPDWFGVPVRGGLHDFRLDGFGRPRPSVGPGAGAWLGGSSSPWLAGTWSTSVWPAGARPSGGPRGSVGAWPASPPAMPRGGTAPAPSPGAFPGRGGLADFALPGVSSGRPIAFAGGSAPWASAGWRPSAFSLGPSFGGPFFGRAAGPSGLPGSSPAAFGAPFGPSPFGAPPSFRAWPASFRAFMTSGAGAPFRGPAGAPSFFGGSPRRPVPGGFGASPFRGLPSSFVAAFAPPSWSGSSWGLASWPGSGSGGWFAPPGASFTPSFAPGSFGAPGSFRAPGSFGPFGGFAGGSWRPRAVARPRFGAPSGPWSGAGAPATWSGAGAPPALRLGSTGARPSWSTGAWSTGAWSTGSWPTGSSTTGPWSLPSLPGSWSTASWSTGSASIGDPWAFPSFGSARPTALGLDLGLSGAGRLPLFPGAGLSWRAMSPTSAPPPALRALRAATMPATAAGWRSAFGAFAAPSFGGLTAPSGAFASPPFTSGAVGSPAGFLVPGGFGLPTGFTRGLTSGTSGFGSAFRPLPGAAFGSWSPARLAALVPALGDTGLQAASALPLLAALTPAPFASPFAAPSAPRAGLGASPGSAPITGVVPSGLDVPLRLAALASGGAHDVGAWSALVDRPLGELALPGAGAPGVAIALPRGGWASGDTVVARRGRLPAFGAAGLTMPARLPGWEGPLDGLVGRRGLVRPGRFVGRERSPSLGSAVRSLSPAAGSPSAPRLAQRLHGELPGVDPVVLQGLALAGLVAPGLVSQAPFGWPSLGLPGLGAADALAPAGGVAPTGVDGVGSPRGRFGSIPGLEGVLGLVPASVASPTASTGRSPAWLADRLGAPDDGALPSLGLRLADAPGEIDLRAGAMELPRVAVPFPEASPGADLARHLMGLPVQPGGGGAMQLGRYDGVAWSRSRDAGLLRPGGWRGLAAHDLARPALGLREATGLAAGKLPRRLQALQARAGSLAGVARPRSALDLAGLDGGPRVVPAVVDRLEQPVAPVRAPAAPAALARGLATPRAQVVGGRPLPARGALPARPGAPLAGPAVRGAARRSRAGGRLATPDLGGVRPRVMPGWQALAAEQFDGLEPVFAYGAAEEPAALRPLASRAELVTPAAAGRVETPWGSVPLGVMRAGSDGASLGGALRPRTAAGDRGLLQQALVGRGLPPRLASRAAALAGARPGLGAPLALPRSASPLAADGATPAGATSPWSRLLGDGAGGDDGLVGGRAGRPTARAAGRRAAGEPVAPDQVLLGGAPRFAPAAGAGALDPALLGLLGQGPRVRGQSGLGWLGRPTARRMATPVGRDVAGALPLPLREFVRGGPAPTATVRLVTAPDTTTVAPATGAAPAAAPSAAPEREGELVRPVAPVHVVASPPAARAPSATPSSPPAAAVAAPGQPAARPAARRTARPAPSSRPKRVDMEHTNLVAGVAGGGVLRKLDAADADPGGDKGETGASRESSSVEAAVPARPADLSLLVNQIYAQIKRELTIERERKG